MAYIPPLGDAVNFNATVPIFIPVGNAISFNISTNVVGISVEPKFITIGNKRWYYTEAVVIVPGTTLINLFNTEFEINPVITIGIPTTLIQVANEQFKLKELPDIVPTTCMIKMCAVDGLIRGTDLAYALPTGIKGGIGVNWQKPIFTQRSLELNWGDATKLDEFQNILFNEADKSDDKIEDGWKLLLQSDILSEISLNTQMSFVDEKTGTFWKVFEIVDEFNVGKWEFFTEYNNFVLVNYNSPPPVDSIKKVDYIPLSIFDELHYISWNANGIKDTHKTIPWGPVSYFAYCSTRYFPPTDGVINFELLDVDPRTVNIGMNIQFNVEGWNTDPRCPYDHTHTGVRDPYTGGGIHVNVDFPYVPTIKEQYYMLSLIHI